MTGVEPGDFKMKRISFLSEYTLSRAMRNCCVLLLLALALAGCNRPQSGAQAFPPANVTVGKPVQKEVVNWSEFTGRTAAVNLVNVTARVSGYIVSIPFKEGDMVHKGDLLYQIDPRPYQDVYDQALGQLKQAQANQQLQEGTYERQP